MSNPTVLIETPMGEMLVELWPDKAPETVANFLAYVDEEFYDGGGNQGAIGFSRQK